jgi:superoxide reductase
MAAQEKEKSMNRRDFIRTALVAGGALAAGKVHAGNYDQQEKQGINRLSNRETPSVMEKKHVPAIESPQAVKSGEWFMVKVRVGYVTEHPSTPGHWITTVKLLLDGQAVAKTSYDKGGISASGATFRIRLNKTSSLEAIERCNLHGTWISDPLKITVV